MKNSMSINYINKPLMTEFEHNGITIQFDTLLCQTDLHTFIVLCERFDNAGPRITSVMKKCLNHLQRHNVWSTGNASRTNFIYFDPATGHTVRLTPEISKTGVILDVVWDSAQSEFAERLGLLKYVPGDNQEPLGLFTQDSCF